jgi:hypothetical protein
LGIDGVLPPGSGLLPSPAAFSEVFFPLPPLWPLLLCVARMLRSVSCLVVGAILVFPSVCTVAVCPGGMLMVCPFGVSSVNTQTRQSLLALVIFVFGS